MSKRRAPIKFEDKRTGWLGEDATSRVQKRFVKRLEHRHNRWYGKSLTRALLASLEQID